MLIEVAGWVAPHGGLISTWMASVPRALLLFVLLLAGALILFYGRSLYSSTSTWRAALSAVPPVAWMLSKALKGSNSPKTNLDKRTCVVEKIPNQDTVEARRLSRSEFYRLNKQFDYNSSPVDVFKSPKPNDPNAPPLVPSFHTPPRYSVPSLHNDKDLGLKVTETFVRNSRGLEIFVKSWVAVEGEPNGLIFLCHGYGDTITFFTEGVARSLALAGYAVYGMDYPGHGLSEGLHTYIPDFDKLVDDVMEQYAMIKGRPEFEGLPCFLFGESMGGAVALKAHLKNPSMWDGAILVAPMCKIAETMYPPWYLVKIMIALAHIIPKAKLVPNNNIATIGCRDLEKRKIASVNPVAYVGNPRLGTALSLLQTTDDIASKLHEVSLPMLVLHGAADQVTDPSISKILFEKAKSKDKTIQLYEDAWHCLLLGEPDDVVKRVVKDIISWLDAHSAPKLAKPESKTSEQKSSGKNLEERVAIAAETLIRFGILEVVQ